MIRREYGVSIVTAFTTIKIINKAYMTPAANDPDLTSMHQQKRWNLWSQQYLFSHRSYGPSAVF